LVLSGNTLYGTADGGGTNGFGTVFKVNTDGTSFTVLFTFMGPSYPYSIDGAFPLAALICRTILYTVRPAAVALMGMAWCSGSTLMAPVLQTCIASPR